MKRKLLLGVILTLTLSLTGCSSDGSADEYESSTTTPVLLKQQTATPVPSTYEDEPEETEAVKEETSTKDMLPYTDGKVDWERLELISIKVSADEIVHHNLPKEERILIQGIINNITEDSFELWMPYGTSYYKDADWEYDIDLGDITNGDTVEICIGTHIDGSMKQSDGILAIRKLDEPIVENIVSVFKDTCPSIDYKTIMRNPENAYGTLCKASGTVFQVIETDDYTQEFLLKLNDGNMVYVTYYKEENADNMLENDIVDVYGTFYVTKSYTTLLGESKTVPKLAVDYVDLQ